MSIDYSTEKRGNVTFITYNGETKPLRSWAKELGVKPKTFWTRLKSGWSMRKATTIKDGRTARTHFENNRSRRIEYNEQTKTIREWSLETKIPSSVILHRLHRGWTSERILTTPVYDMASLGGLASKHKSEYHTWIGMIKRCCDSNNRAWKNYGERGIIVCERWKNSFADFLTDMGNRPAKGYSIDRINNNGNYEPSNCRWTTATVQTRNRRTNVPLTFKGETLCLSEWAERTGIKKTCLWERIFTRKWSVEKALTTPPYEPGQHPKPKAETFTFDGVTKTVAQWARDQKIDSEVVRLRRKQGWTTAEALFTSVRKYGGRHRKRSNAPDACQSSLSESADPHPQTKSP